MTAFQSPASWRDVLSVVEAHARESGAQVWTVGGTVRDVLRGRDTRDLDLAVDQNALRWARRLADLLNGSFVALDDENAVARIVLEGRHIDVAQLRGTIEDDLRRRDFTIDALAVLLGARNVIDVTGGLDDLKNRRLRMTSEQSLDDDPLRMLRAVRIAHELRFAIESRTGDAIRARTPAINAISPERIRDELARMLALPNAYDAFRALDDMRLLDEAIPELAAGRRVTQPEEFHVYDVFEHNIRALEAMDLMLREVPHEGGRPWLRDELWAAFEWCAPRLRAYLGEELTEGHTRAALLRFAVLLHDVGKPATRSVDAGGRIRFFGHARAGAALAARIMHRLRFSTRETQFVRLLVAEHLRPVQLAQKGAAPTRKALYRFYRDLPHAIPAVLLLSLADGAASAGPRLTPEGWAAQVRYMNSLLVRSQEEEGIVSPPRLLTGRDIMRELGESEGPHIGRLLEALTEAQAAGEVTDTRGALAFVRELARKERRRGVERS
ncbi:MAG: HD domain-containing protein [Dehalococcoidia bacterium]